MLIAVASTDPSTRPRTVAVASEAAPDASRYRTYQRAAVSARAVGRACDAQPARPHEIAQ